MAIENIPVNSLNQTITDYTSSIFNRDSNSTNLSITDIANRVREVYDKDGKKEAIKEALYLIFLLEKNGQEDFAKTVLDQLSPDPLNVITSRFDKGQWAYLTEERVTAWPLEIRFYYNTLKKINDPQYYPASYPERMRVKAIESQKSMFETNNPLQFSKGDKICSSLTTDIRDIFAPQAVKETSSICLPVSNDVKVDPQLKLKTFFSKIFSKPCPLLQETYKIVEVILQASPEESRAILEDSVMRDRIIEFFQPRQTLILMESLLANSMIWDGNAYSNDLNDFLLLHNFPDTSRATNTFVKLQTTDCLGVILYSAYLSKQITRRELAEIFFQKIWPYDQSEIQQRKLEANQRSQVYSAEKPPLPGTLLEISYKSKFDHTMLYVGNGMALSFWSIPQRNRISLIDLSKMTHGKKVKITTLEPYWIRPDKKKK